MKTKNKKIFNKSRKLPGLALFSIFLVGFVDPNVYTSSFGRIDYYDNSSYSKKRGRGQEKEIGMVKDDSLIDALEEDNYDAYIEALSENDREFMVSHVTEEIFNKRFLTYQNRKIVRKEMGAAIDLEYENWKKVVDSLDIEVPHEEFITPENFKTFAEIYESRLANKLGFKHQMGEGQDKINSEMRESYANVA